MKELIKDAFAQMDQYCAQKMFDELQKAGGKASMETVKLAVCGTTCTMAIIMDDDIVIANVGDSRSILFCHKDLRKVSSRVASKSVNFKVAGLFENGR